MPDSNTYTDLVVRIYAQKRDEAYYPAEAHLSDGSHFLNGELYIDEKKLRANEQDPHLYGLDLFYMLFAGKMREAYDIATGLANAETDGRLRLRLWIDAEAPELHALIWERMCQQTQTPVSTSALTPLSRYLELPSAEPDPVTQWPRRLLFAIANPKNLEERNLARLDVEREVRNLMNAVSIAQQAGLLQITLMPGITGLSDELRAEAEEAGYTICDDATDFTNILKLLNQDTYHILHFLGHGYFSRGENSTSLIMENRNGNAKPYRDQAIAEALQALAAPPRLVFIAACESARRDPRDGNPYIGLAPKLVAAGIPAVIAMQDVVPMSSNQALTHDFYRHLLQHGIVDLALNQARLPLYGTSDKDWAIPTLLMRLKQGQLFTKDPVRTALNAMVTANVFNPLPAGEAYLPVEVQHFKGTLNAQDLRTLARMDVPTMYLLAAVEKIFAPAKLEIGPHGPSILLLVGDEGMGKSVSLRYLGKLTAHKSLQDDVVHTIIPVYINLEDLPINIRMDSQHIKERIVQALAAFWPTNTEQQPEDMLNKHTGPILRVMVDGSDTLLDHTRHRAWEALNQFIMENPRHEYIVVTNPSGLDRSALRITDVLIMQPISRHNIQHFLTETLQDPAGSTLYSAIERAQLFDLAAMPWLLFEMLKQTQRGDPPQSRAQVLRNFVEDRIIDIAPDSGMRARASETLEALAWELQMQRKNALPLDTAFAIMNDVRGQRGYSREQLYQELSRHELLEPMGEESLCFTRRIVRAYCFARALLKREDRDAHINDITATLGRYNRYRWWEEALTLFSGMTNAPARLIRQILYGVPLGEGDQIFLAARCIQECSQTVSLDPQIIDYTANTLLWRLRYGTDPRVSRRIRIIQALAQLKHPASIMVLTEIAYPQTAPPPMSDTDYEYNTIRLAAVMALRQIVPPPYVAIANTAPAFAKLLNHWATQQVEALLPYLMDQDETRSQLQAIAALALGDLKTPRAVNAMITMFMMAGLPSPIRRNLVTALSMLDSATVTQRAILPLLEKEDAERWHPMLAYLIGKVRTQHSAARAFLYTCLRDIGDVAIKGLAIQSLGWLYDVKSKSRIEDVALGDFSSLNLPEDSALTMAQTHVLQRNALEALRYLGDATTLRRLQQRAAAWSPELELAFYWTIEEIITRQNEA